ncbi:hypothetical protein ACROYT_G000886 [Oculina patagonica]
MGLSEFQLPNPLERKHSSRPRFPGKSFAFPSVANWCMSFNNRPSHPNIMPSDETTSLVPQDNSLNWRRRCCKHFSWECFFGIVYSLLLVTDAVLSIRCKILEIAQPGNETAKMADIVDKAVRCKGHRPWLAARVYCSVHEVYIEIILGDPGAVSREDGQVIGTTGFSGESLKQARESPWALSFTEPVPEAFELLPSDWPEKQFFWPISKDDQQSGSDAFLHEVVFLIDSSWLHPCIG